MIRLMSVCALRHLALFSLIFAVSAGCGWSPFRPRFDPFDDAYKDTWFSRQAHLQQVRDNPRSLSETESESLARELVETLKDEPNPLIRSEAVKTLTVLPGQTSGQGLLLAMRDRERDIRIDACKGLGQRGGEIAIEELTRAYENDEELDVRLAAVKALGQLTEPSAVAALGKALDDKDPAINYVAIASLKNVSGQNLGNDVRPWREYVASVNNGDRPVRSESGGGLPNPLKRLF